MTPSAASESPASGMLLPRDQLPGPLPPRDQIPGLLADFPCFRIWREQTCDRVRYVARSLHTGLNPHTVVTHDIGELRAALEPSRHVACSVQHAAEQQGIRPMACSLPTPAP